MNALDLTQHPPRSPRELLPGLNLLMAARTVDKIRATLPGGNIGDYQITGFSSSLLNALEIAESVLRKAIAQAPIRRRGRDVDSRAFRPGTLSRNQREVGRPNGRRAPERSRVPSALPGRAKPAARNVAARPSDRRRRGDVRLGTARPAKSPKKNLRQDHAASRILRSRHESGRTTVKVSPRS